MMVMIADFVGFLVAHQPFLKQSHVVFSNITFYLQLFVENTITLNMLFYTCRIEMPNYGIELAC